MGLVQQVRIYYVQLYIYVHVEATSEVVGGKRTNSLFILVTGYYILFYLLVDMAMLHGNSWVYTLDWVYKCPDFAHSQHIFA